MEAIADAYEQLVENIARRARSKENIPVSAVDPPSNPVIPRWRC